MKPSVLLLSVLVFACGSSPQKKEPPPEAKPAPAPAEAKPVSGQIPNAPMVEAETVVAIAKAEAPEGASSAEQMELDGIVAQLRAGRVTTANQAWRAFAKRYYAARAGEEPDAVVHWIVRRSHLEPASGVSAAAAKVVRHDRKKTAIEEEVALAKDIANSLIDEDMIRYERLDPETMKRSDPRRITRDELSIYAESLQTAAAKQAEARGELVQQLENAMRRDAPAMQRLSNARAQLLKTAAAGK